MKKRKSLAFVCAALASLATFSTACAKDTVTWWSWSTRANPKRSSSQATFAEENADISVDLQFAAAADYWVKLPVAIAAGTGPDVYQMTRPDFESYAASNQTMDLTDVISNSPLLQEYLNNLDPVLVDTYKFDGNRWQFRLMWSVLRSLIIRILHTQPELI